MLRPSLTEPLLYYTEFYGWLHVWSMDVPRNNGGDFLTFANENKDKFLNVVKNKMDQLGSVKV